MKKIILMMIMIFCADQFVTATSEFVKVKQKKESASQVRDDIVELLESVLRQVGQNIQQGVDTQNQIFDSIKKMFTENELSIQQLKDMRCKLEKHLKKIEEHQAELYDILLCCK